MALPSRITIHTIDLNFRGVAKVIAAFLIEGSSGLILIETGPESCRDTLLEEIEKLGFRPADVAGVFVTHIHLDHSGGAGWWAARGVPVYVHPKGARHLIDPSRLEESARMVYGAEFDHLWGALHPAPAEFVKEIGDQETLTIGGLEIQAIDTPGHAFHHHAFAVGKTLFTGDAAGIRLPGFDYISVAAAPPQFHLEHTLETIDKLAAGNYESLYLTHFGKVDDPARHFADYRDAVELNAEFIRARLADGMDSESLKIAYEAINLEQAFRLRVPHADFCCYQIANGTGMCADGIRMYWEKQAG